MSIENQKALLKNEAENIAKLWRQQSFSSDSAICHNPGYAIKFYSQNKLTVYVTLCWDCDNIEFLTPKVENYLSFKGNSTEGQQFLKTLEKHFPNEN